VIADGGSTDGTLESLERLATGDSRFAILSAPGATIARGRNVAIERARGPLIAVTDAGTRADPTWLERLIAPLEADPTVDVSSGFYVAGGETWLERSLSTVITPQLPEIDPERFLPSSRSVAFRKEAWQRVGGYPEWLRHCEDLVFNLDLRRDGARLVFTPDAVVTWQARPDLRQFFRQYFYYARGDGHAHLYAGRHAVRYLAYASGVGLAALGRRSWTARSLLAVGMAAHFAPYMRRVRRRPVSESRVGQLTALAVTPVAVVTGDVAKILGYAVGLRERSAVQRSRRAAPGQVDR
jgi:cellulose synthase/poly-beta-1,6-N-acetylglucosamine synthase-like glycosyltransferase